MTTRSKKRFVAGATCPECKAQDTIMLFFENNVEKLECIQCGYHESQADKPINDAKRQKESVIGVFKP